MVPFAMDADLARPATPSARTSADPDDATAAVAWLARQLAWCEWLEHLGRRHVEALTDERGSDSACGPP